MQRILFVIVTSICIALPSSASAKCRGWNFSLATLLRVTAAGMVVVGYIGNNMRHRAAFEAWSKSVVPPLDENQETEAWREYESKRSASYAIMSTGAVTSLKKIIEGDPALREKTKNLGINWNRLVNRAKMVEETMARDREEALKNPGNKKFLQKQQESAIDLHYAAWEETKALVPIYRAVFDNEAQKGTPRAHVADELQRQHGLENGREWFKNRESPPWYVDTYASAWREHHKITIEDFLKALLDGEAPSEQVARLSPDFKPHPYAHSSVIHDAINRKWNELELVVGHPMTLDEFLEVFHKQMRTQTPPKDKPTTPKYNF